MPLIRKTPALMYVLLFFVYFNDNNPEKYSTFNNFHSPYFYVFAILYLIQHIN